MLSSLLLMPLVLLLGLVVLLAQHAQPLAASPTAQQAEIPPAGFVPDGGSVRTTTADTRHPALAIPAGSTAPWVAVSQNNRIYVSKFITDTATWTQQGGILNRGSANPASEPALVFAGAAGDTPWAAWSEEVDGTNLLNAAFFNGTSWNLTPIINRNPAHSATTPTLAAGSTTNDGTPLPWLAWTEEDSSGTPQVVVSFAVPDSGRQGGFAWEPAETSLNLDSTRTGNAPDLAFAGPNSTVPWVVWTETGDDRAARVFAKRWNGSTWVAVGRQEGCSDEVTCALNLNANQDAAQVRLATGTLPNQNTPSPWIVFSEMNSSGFQELHVMRLDVGDPGDAADDRFVAVGGAVNAQCLGNAGISVAAANNVNVQSAGLRNAGDAEDANAISGGNATMPDITFVGNVPHVTWVEEAAGRSVLHVCHLADARAGLERWDLDSFDGINRSSAAASAPSLADNGLAPYVAWQEALTQTVVFVSHRAPMCAAWAINFPAVVNNITGAPLTLDEQRTLLAEWGHSAPAAVDEAGAPFLRSDGVAITTAAYHVNGSENLEEIQFQLTSSSAPTDTPPFLARYVISDNLIYVQDPENPGTFFPPVAPGATSNVNTPFVTLETSAVEIVTHGAASAALDVRWSLIFEDATFFKSYAQSVNVLYNGGQETGFHRVGTVYVGNQLYLPIVVQDSGVQE